MKPTDDAVAPLPAMAVTVQIAGGPIVRHPHPSIHNQEGETMDNDEYITVRSPRLARNVYGGYVTVGEEELYAAIEALRIRVAEWDAFMDGQPADETSRTRVAEAAQALADLLAAMAAHQRDGGIRELVRQIAAFMAGEDNPDPQACLDALREELQRAKDDVIKYARPSLSDIYPSKSERRLWEIEEDLDILDALIALHETRARRKAEWGRQHDAGQRTQQQDDQQQATAEQAPDADHEPGWEF
jgi:hypothetical protein